MGTNYYTKNPKYLNDAYDSEYHIGKRSAAGLYCFDCGITLCKKGNQHIHTSDKDKWYDKCPICGNSAEIEKMSDSSVGRELGFNKQEPVNKMGVKSCSSFTWAMEPKKSLVKKYVYTEYGEKITTQDFIDMILKECPVQYYHSIGKQFT